MSDPAPYPNTEIAASLLPEPTNALANYIGRAIRTVMEDAPEGEAEQFTWAVHLGLEMVEEITRVTAFHKPGLGLASNQELQDELFARYDRGFNAPDYRLVGGE